MAEHLVEIRDLRGYFDTIGGEVHALNGVNVSVEEGKVTGLVGETGSGKTVTSLNIPRLLPENFRYVSGEVLFRGEDVLTWPEERMEKFRGSGVGMAFQDPKAALNPVFTVGEQLGRVLRTHTEATKDEAKTATIEMLARVKIADPERTIAQYAHELSGGMAQRVMVALAVIHPPKLLILDEPTTGLDVTVQAEIISMLRDLVNAMGLTVLLITHDLGVVGELCDNVAVMYAGRVMEFGDISQVFERPANPYTRELLRSTESVEGGIGDLYSIRGVPPDLRNLAEGCYFQERCPAVEEDCTTVPGLFNVEPGHTSMCHFAERHYAMPGPLHIMRSRREEGSSDF
jgi:oligopeptide/dipeptide ABC transporter ATP-binding protein